MFLEMISNIRKLAKPNLFHVQLDSITQDKMLSITLLPRSRVHLTWNAKGSQPLLSQNSHNNNCKAGTQWTDMSIVHATASRLA